MLKHIALAGAALAALLPAAASAQRSTPVSVVNTDPVPVEVAFEPYQWPFRVGTVRNEFIICDQVPVPAGKVLVIEMVSAQLETINPDIKGSFYLDLRSVETGVSTTRPFGGEIHREGFSDTMRQLRWPMTLYAGPTTNGTDEVDLCTGPGTEAQGVVTGYLMQAKTITDPE